jgi:hypothetical protein
MDQEFTVKSVLIGGIPLFTDHGLLLSSDVAQVVAAIGAILATAMAYVQRIGATLLLGISLGLETLFANSALALRKLIAGAAGGTGCLTGRGESQKTNNEPHAPREFPIECYGN